MSHSIATMVEVLRNDAGSLGLITANGGYVTKHALGLYSTEPSDGPFVSEDVQPVVDAVPRRPGDEQFVGSGTIEASTVMHDVEGPASGLVAVRTPAGARTWASTTDLDLMNWLMTDDSTAASCSVDPDGRLRS